MVKPFGLRFSVGANRLLRRLHHEAYSALLARAPPCGGILDLGTPGHGNRRNVWENLVRDSKRSGLEAIPDMRECTVAFRLYLQSLLNFSWAAHILYHLYLYHCVLDGFCTVLFLILTAVLFFLN